MSEWDDFSSEMEDMEEDWRGEVDNAARLGGVQAYLLHDMLEICRDNERKYGDTFSPTAIAGRMIGVPADYVKRLEAGVEPFADDLFAFAQAAGIELSFLPLRSAVDDWTLSGTIDNDDMYDTDAPLLMTPTVKEETW